MNVWVVVALKEDDHQNKFREPNSELPAIYGMRESSGIFRPHDYCEEAGFANQCPNSPTIVEN